MQDYTFIGFLITCVLGLASFCVFLVKKVIAITKENTEAFKDLKHAIYSNTTAVNDLKSIIR